MKYSKFIAVLLVMALAFGNISTAFAFTDNTTIQKDTSEGRATAKAGADMFISVVAGTAMTETALTTIGSGVATVITGATGVALAPTVVGGVIVAGAATAACIAVNCFIDWIW